MVFELIDTDSNELRREVYRFWVWERGQKIHVILNSYAEQTRPSRRHQTWTTGQSYDRTNKRDTTWKEEPTLPPGVRDRAVAEVRDMVVFNTWEHARDR